MSYKLNIKLYYIFTVTIYFYIWMPIWVIYFQKKGLSLSQIGILDAVGYLLMVLSEVPTGIIADKYGRKYSLALGALLYSIGMFGIIFELFSFWFLVGYVFWNISNTFLTGANIAILRESLDRLNELDKFPKILGRSNTIMMMSQIVASGLCGTVAAHSLELTFILSGIVTLIGFIIPLFMKETLLKCNEERESYLTILKGTYDLIKTDKGIILILLYSSLVSSLVFILTYTIYQPYSKEIGYSISELSIILILLKLFSALGGILTGWINTKIPLRYTFWIIPSFLIILSIFIGIFTFKLSITYLLIFVLICTCFSPNISHYLNLKIKDNIRATVMSFQGLLWTLIAFFLDPLILFLADTTKASLAIMIVCLAISLILLWLAIFILKDEHLEGY
ncbi:MFS transporter [Macrococcus capreoli]|uniref:MFS transporter n=1 Tax=Macrococcus capreoli TaxID=2982690 RepID=UPI003EE722F0